MPTTRHRVAVHVGLVASALALGAAVMVAAAPVDAAPPVLPAMLANGTVCGLVKGAPYSYKAQSGAKLAGNQYNVTSAGFSCASAKTYSIALSFADPKVYIDTFELSLLYNHAGKVFAKWPHDFTCAGASYRLTRHKPPTISGYCWKGDVTDPFSPKNTALFDWVAKPSSG